MPKKLFVDDDANVDYVPEEKDDFYSDDDLYNISSWGADLSFRELVARYKDGELVKPEMQRNYVWDKVEASRFVDSVLLGLPVPSIFLAKTSEEKMLIVDGYQRIMTIYDYVEEKTFRTDKKLFRLTNSAKINARWKGKCFDELSDAEQRKIKNTTIHCIVFVQLKPTNDDTSIYQVFERINSSGRALVPQEIRNCVYQGPFNSLLIELNRNPQWRSLYGLAEADQRMRDMEFILRYFALASQKWDQNATGAISLKKFLNQYMGKNRSPNKEALKAYRDQFLSTIEFIYKEIGGDAFHNVSAIRRGQSAGKFNPTIFDSIAIATYLALQEGKKVKTKDLKANRQLLLGDEKYQDLIRNRTTSENRIAERITMALEYLYGMTYEEH